MNAAKRAVAVQYAAIFPLMASSSVPVLHVADGDAAQEEEDDDGDHHADVDLRLLLGRLHDRPRVVLIEAHGTGGFRLVARADCTVPEGARVRAGVSSPRPLPPAAGP